MDDKNIVSKETVKEIYSLLCALEVRGDSVIILASVLARLKELIK